MTPREVMPADVSEETEKEVWEAFKKMVDGLRVYEARIKPSPWKPIETAPMDNTFIILAGKDEDGVWTVDMGHWETYSLWDGDEEMTPEWSWSENTAPTHWMHFPDPPKDE
jgi:hypothetical protein